MLPITRTCEAAVNGGEARCRLTVVSQGMATHGTAGRRCFNHQGKGWPVAPRPDVVLVKVNLNKAWEAHFTEVGIPTQERSFGRACELELQRVERAAELHRSAYAIREKRGGDHGSPEAADDGSPVFGSRGLRGVGVNIQWLAYELAAAGFVLTDAHLLRRGHKPPVRLVLQFSKKDLGLEVINDFPWQLFQGLIRTSFQQVDVWANSRSSRTHRVTHTVNCGRREDSLSPYCQLKFAGGNWDIEEVAVPAATTATDAGR